jgi:hypothetical protein
VPNKVLEWWDAPMPAAKILFEIVSGPGFFKEADKGGIYYLFLKSGMYADSGEVFLEKHKVFTNPFYEVEIPASPKIPPFVNNGGYDYDSWGWTSTPGPYDFWTIFNRPPNPLDPSKNQDPAHPTFVEVYSDNHGEAMVYLNGVWNLNLDAYFKGVLVSGAELMQIPPGTIVGTTTVVAKADYPYFRKHSPMVSNTVEKKWTFDKDVEKWVEQIKYEPAQNPADQQIFVKRIWVVLTNADKLMATEHQVWDPVAQKFSNDPAVNPLAQKVVRVSPPEVIGWVLEGVGILEDVEAPPESIFTFQGKPAALSTSRLPTDAEAAKLGQVGKLNKVIIETVKVSASNQAAGTEPENRYRYYRYDLAWAVISTSFPGKADLSIRVFEPLLVLKSGKNVVLATVQVHDKPLDFAVEDPYDPILTGLSKGWNLIPFFEAYGWTKEVGTQPVTLFFTEHPAIVNVWNYDNGAQKWLGASRTVPAWANNLPQVEYGKAYFVYNKP